MILPLVAVAYVYTLPESPRCVGASAQSDENRQSCNTDPSVIGQMASFKSSSRENAEFRRRFHRALQVTAHTFAGCSRSFSHGPSP